jgi:hypothetical protein
MISTLKYECDFDPYECDYDTHECNFDMHECDSDTLRVTIKLTK